MQASDFSLETGNVWIDIKSIAQVSSMIGGLFTEMGFDGLICVR
jgi:hypothetical protein